MKLYRRIHKSIVFLQLLLLLAFVQQGISKEQIRIALFNIREMSTENLKDVTSDGIGQHSQLLAAAKIIQRVNPDILIINEIDHDLSGAEAADDLALNARRFNAAYLNQGESALDYKYSFAAPCNTGILAGKDLDNNGKIATDSDRGSRDHGGDCYGYGAYPGQYSMAILSRIPIETDQVRTFQKFLWKDLPDNMIPEGWYSEDELEIFRLSSKSHWDVPVKIEGKIVHLLLSHPTPPVFDGDEDRNGRRNYDEIKLWVDYIDGKQELVDDQGKSGGLGAGSHFIIAGDLNAAPQGDKLENGKRAIDQLLQHPAIQDCGDVLVSKGALRGEEPGPPLYAERRTTGWRGRGMRVDHLLPSQSLNVAGGGVFWPDKTVDPEGNALAEKASDHRLIWLDIKTK